jgi:hypothetical protein
MLEPVMTAARAGQSETCALKRLDEIGAGYRWQW